MITLNLREIRGQRGWTMKDISSKIGISESYYCLIENDKRTPSVNVAKKLGDLLQIEWADFYSDASAEGN